MSSTIRTKGFTPDKISGVSGRVITPHDSDYDNARTVFYGGIDKRPSAIIRVSDADDVSRVIAIARKEGLELAIRSGGHSVVGHSTTDGGLVIDLRDMSKIEIDQRARTAWVETGATAIQVTQALSEHGMVIGFGDSGSVGIGGITLGGGIGFLVRKFGMTIDSLLAAEVVTADGRHIRADASEHADLFWAIRGGGGNFGVVTRFKFRLHELPHFTGGMLVLPATPETIRGFALASANAPNELSTIGNVMPGSHLPFLPEAARNQLVIFAFIAFAGDDESAERAIAPFRALATPLADMVERGSYVAMYPPENPDYRPMAVGRTMFINAVDEARAATMFDYLSKSDAAMRVAQIRVLGGAFAQVPDDATAFAHRSQPILVNVAAFYTGAADREVRSTWTTEFMHALHPNERAAYVGFLTDDGQARIGDAYPPATADRLRKVKSAYDPTNLFRLNQNITAS
jgi:FAD/FMN-containing dehydrogenase